MPLQLKVDLRLVTSAGCVPGVTSSTGSGVAACCGFLVFTLPFDTRDLVLLLALLTAFSMAYSGVKWSVFWEAAGSAPGSSPLGGLQSSRGSLADVFSFCLAGRSLLFV